MMSLTRHVLVTMRASGSVDWSPAGLAVKLGPEYPFAAPNAAEIRRALDALVVLGDVTRTDTDPWEPTYRVAVKP